MKTSRFSAEQIVSILNEAAAKETKVVEVCRKHGITEQTYYRWRRAYGGLQVDEAKRPARARGRESALEEARGGASVRPRDAERRGGKKVVTTTQRRQVVTHLIAALRISARRASG